MIKTVLDITALASGTSAINVAPNTAGAYPSARVSGTTALTGTYNISPTGTPIKNSFVEIYWEASLSNGASNAVAIFGKTVPAELITSGSKFKVDCLYNGTAWVVDIMPDDAGTGIVGTARVADSAVTTAKIADDAVTLAKMAGLAKGKIIYGDASGNPADIELGSANGRLLFGDTGAGVTVADMSGDATIAKTGALTIANNAVTTAKINAAAVTPAKLSSSANKGQFAVQLEFDNAAKVGVIKYQICSTCTIDGIYATVNRAPATDTAVVIPKNHGGVAMTGGQIDITTALALGNIVSVTPTANNTFTAGEQLTLETSKTTKEACTITVMVCYTVTA